MTTFTIPQRTVQHHVHSQGRTATATLHTQTLFPDPADTMSPVHRSPFLLALLTPRPLHLYEPVYAPHISGVTWDLSFCPWLAFFFLIF